MNKKIVEIIKLCGAGYTSERGERYCFEAFGVKMMITAKLVNEKKTRYLVSSGNFCGEDESLERAIILLLSLLYAPKEKKFARIKHAILDTALKLAEITPYIELTRKQIAKKLDITQSLISYYYGTQTELRRKIVETAVKRANLTVIAQALIFNDPIVQDIDPNLAIRALNHPRKNV